MILEWAIVLGIMWANACEAAGSLCDAERATIWARRWPEEASSQRAAAITPSEICMAAGRGPWRCRKLHWAGQLAEEELRSGATAESVQDG